MQCHVENTRHHSVWKEGGMVPVLSNKEQAQEGTEVITGREMHLGSKEAEGLSLPAAAH